MKPFSLSLSIALSMKPPWPHDTNMFYVFHWTGLRANLHRKPWFLQVLTGFLPLKSRGVPVSIFLQANPMNSSFSSTFPGALIPISAWDRPPSPPWASSTPEPPCAPWDPAGGWGRQGVRPTRWSSSWVFQHLCNHLWGFLGFSLEFKYIYICVCVWIYGFLWVGELWEVQPTKIDVYPLNNG